jgi:hypothetical protein
LEYSTHVNSHARTYGVFNETLSVVKLSIVIASTSLYPAVKAFFFDSKLFTFSLGLSIVTIGLSFLLCSLVHVICVSGEDGPIYEVTHFSSLLAQTQIVSNVNNAMPDISSAK